MARYKFYAVRRNNKTFVFDHWYGIGGAEEAVEESAGDPVKARWKGCHTRQEAETYFDGKNETLENYEALMKKYLAGDKSVLPRLKKLAEGMQSNGNTTNTRNTENGVHLDAVRTRRSVYAGAGSRSYRKVARRVFAARAGVASAAGGNRNKF